MSLAVSHSLSISLTLSHSLSVSVTLSDSLSISSCLFQSHSVASSLFLSLSISFNRVRSHIGLWFRCQMTSSPSLWKKSCATSRGNWTRSECYLKLMLSDCCVFMEGNVSDFARKLDAKWLLCEIWYKVIATCSWTYCDCHVNLTQNDRYLLQVLNLLLGAFLFSD